MYSSRVTVAVLDEKRCPCTLLIVSHRKKGLAKIYDSVHCCGLASYSDIIWCKASTECTKVNAPMTCLNICGVKGLK